MASHSPTPVLSMAIHSLNAGRKLATLNLNLVQDLAIHISSPGQDLASHDPNLGQDQATLKLNLVQDLAGLNPRIDSQKNPTGA